MHIYICIYIHIICIYHIYIYHTYIYITYIYNMIVISCHVHVFHQEIHLLNPCINACWRNGYPNTCCATTPRLISEQCVDFTRCCRGCWPIKTHVPSGKHTKNYGKSPFLMGKSTINGPFSIAMLNNQMV